MKSNYEDRFRFMLPRRTHTIIRLDGKAFHSFTRGCEVPFDFVLMEDINRSVCILCDEIQGCLFAFCQSDEVSILMTDFKKITTDAWFDGNVQKIVSISASILTAAFNDIIRQEQRKYARGLAYFDSRVFVIPDPVEVENYFIWRQKDAERNSINMAAQCYFSDRDLDGKSCDERQEMLFQRGVNWNDYPTGAKRGRVIRKSPLGTGWLVEEPPIFTQKREYLQELIALGNRVD